MIRFIHCVKSLPELSAVEFRRFFHSGDMKRLLDQMALRSNAIDYKLSLTLQVEANHGLMEDRGGAEPFDALVEIWWDSGHDLLELAETDEFKALIAQAEDFQRQFVDFSRSSRFFVEE